MGREREDDRLWGSPLNSGLDGRRLWIGPPCHYCGGSRGTTRDHVVPLDRGGANARWNIVPACGPCNGRKANSPPTCRCEWCTRAVAKHADFARTLPKHLAYSRLRRINPILRAYGFEPVPEQQYREWYSPWLDASKFRISSRKFYRASLE